MEVANLAYYLVVSHCIIKTFYQRSIFAFYKAALGIANLSKYDVAGLVITITALKK